MSNADERIECKICGAKVHSIQLHIKDSHKDTWTIDSYKSNFPDAPILSPLAEEKVRAAMKAKKEEGEASGSVAMSTGAKVIPIGSSAPNTVIKQALHETFGLPESAATLSSQGKPIPISVVQNCDSPEMVPEVQKGYVYDPEELKNVMLGIELNIPIYIWGHKGSGKSALCKQVAARTGRPLIRVQHTVNTEESHIVGQWTVKGGETVFELGPLPIAMKNGWVYLADEYDFALPSVLSAYQAVLEGEPLLIKEANAESRMIKPHPNFRIIATGNTNGSGDETGLYQGTVIQNSANFDRFGIVIHKKYMNMAAESQILQNECRLQKSDADKLAEFAHLIRESYDGKKMSDVISPRALIYAGMIGVKRASFRQGLALSFINKLNKVDAAVADGVAKRIFGA